MRSIIGFAVSGLFCLAFISCENRLDQLAVYSDKQLILTASTEAPVGKTVLDSNTGKVYWQPAEEISVFYGKVNSRFVSTNTQIAEVADFIGSIPGVGSIEECQLSSDKPLVALYPYNAGSTYDGVDLVATLPENQTGTEGSFAKGQNLTVSKSAGPDLRFINVCGGVRFSLTESGITKVSFRGNEGEVLAGSAVIAWDADGYPLVSGVTDARNEITLTLSGGAAFKTGVYYYISTLPATLSHGYTITFSNSSKRGQRTSLNPVSIRRAELGSLTNADKNVEYKVWTPQDKKQFVIFDALSYAGKPDLKADKISPIQVVYEASLLTDGAIDQDKLESVSTMAKVIGIKNISIDIECWFGNSSSTIPLAANLETVFDAFRDKMGSCIIGNYGLPVKNLSTVRDNPNNVGKPEATIISTWKNSNRMAAGAVCDVLMPSLYIVSDNVEQWGKDVKTTVDYIKENYPDKKIYGYIWPQFYDMAGSSKYMEFISGESWGKMLEICYQYLDGVILWSNGRDKNGNTVSWTDNRVQEFYNTTKDFIARYYQNVIFDTSNISDDDPGQEPSEFLVYHSINFAGTPRNLLKFGAAPINYMKETKVSETVKAGNVYEPALNKIKYVAYYAKSPVCIDVQTWINDRSSAHQTMINRFSNVQAAFKSINPTAQLGYISVWPTCATKLIPQGLYASDNARKKSWYEYAVKPTSDLCQYADVIFTDVTMVDDDIQTWIHDVKSELDLAKEKNPGKKVIACLGTVYYGSSTEKWTFGKVGQPIAKETFLAGLEYLYKRCDGVHIVGTCTSNKMVEYSEDISIIRALDEFYRNHKSIIDKTLPSYVDEEPEIPYPGKSGDSEQYGSSIFDWGTAGYDK